MLFNSVLDMFLSAYFRMQYCVLPLVHIDKTLSVLLAWCVYCREHYVLKLKCWVEQWSQGNQLNFSLSSESYNCDGIPTASKQISVSEAVCGNTVHYSEVCLLHVGAGTHVCSVCDCSFPWKTALNLHLKNHSVNQGYKCSTCGKDYQSRQRLIRHLRSHREEGPFSCEICSQNFKHFYEVSARYVGMLQFTRLIWIFMRRDI